MKNLRISKKFLAIVVSALGLSALSCNDEKEFLNSDVKSPSAMRINSDIDKLYNEKSSLEREFGKSLAKSLNESRMLREVIKNKALEMFNDDYEILYEMLKDEKVENNLTVEDLITKNLTDKKSLKALDSEYPTLSILVPSLPKDVFNANKWNVDTEIPKVAIRLTTTNDVPIINADGSENLLEGKYTPAFPIVVVKENERVITDKNKDFKNLKTRSIDSKRGVKFKFLSDEFDRKLKKTKRLAFGVQLDPKLISAYDTYKNADGWQRDLIYYNITPNQTRGQFSYDFKDGLKSFRMVGDPMTAYNKIADQWDDPHIYGITTGPQWTDGFFEFKVTCLVNGRNGVGSELTVPFGANPSDLFELTYTDVGGWFNSIYLLTGVSLKQMDLNLPIFNWDLNQFSAAIKIGIEEMDLTTITVLSESTTVKFANNFEITSGLIEKVGLKFGSSSETTQTRTYQRTFTQGNDQLGDVTINFADEIINTKLPFIDLYSLREYNTGWYSISFEPMRVQ